MESLDQHVEWRPIRHHNIFDTINLLKCLKIATVDIIKALLWLHRLFEFD